jgi:hypothetical protein
VPGQTATDEEICFIRRAPLMSVNRHLLVDAELGLEERVMLSCLVDSGATGSFITNKLITKYQIPTRKKARPVRLTVVDGRETSAGLVTHETVPLPVRIGDHVEQLAFDITDLGPHAAILGLPWLERHDPEIKWSNRTISFSSDYCRDHCLKEGKGVCFSTAQPQPVSSFSAPSFSSSFSAPVTSSVEPPEEPLVLAAAVAEPAAPLLLPESERISEEFGIPSVEFSESHAISFISSEELELDAEDTVFVLATDAEVVDDGGGRVPPVYLREFGDVFDEQLADELPPHRPTDHRIVVQDDKQPPFGPLYRLSEPELAELRRYLDENLRKGFIRRSGSPAGAPILFVKKKSGELRLCVDYRGLNAVSVKDRYPLPLIGELLDRLRGATVFTKIDLRSAYNLVRIAAGDEWKTAFRTRYGQYEYKVMPFGLCNAPATFQRFINLVLHDYLDNFCVAYLDDILVFSTTTAEHEQHVGRVLGRLREFKLFANAAKCEFHVARTEFLGYVISPQGIETDQAKVAAVRDWPLPQNRRDVQSFLGLANYYRIFVAGYSRIALPLTRLTGKDVPFVWSDDEQRAFDVLRAQLLSAPVLRYFDPMLPATLDTDASDFATGAALLQPDDAGRLHPVAFYSHKMSKEERNYHAHDKELLAIMLALAEWRAYLEGAQHRFTIRMDHRNLLFFLDARKLNARQVRWKLELSKYDFEIVYRPGVQNTCADALSRRADHRPVGEEDRAAPESLLSRAMFALPEAHAAPVQVAPIPPSFAESMRIAQRADPMLRELLQTLPDGYSAPEGLLRHDGRVVVPELLAARRAVLELMHDSPFAGHWGRRRTQELVRRYFVWDMLNADVERYVAACDSCQRDKNAHHRPYGMLKSLEVPEKPWESISMDFISGLTNVDGYNAILVVVDRFSKMNIYIPTGTNADMHEVKALLEEHVFNVFGYPKSIVSDRDARFVSRFWRDWAVEKDVALCLSSAFHPQTDGQTERANQTLEQYLRIYSDEAQTNWPDLLPHAQFAYNNSVHDATQLTPYFVVHGHHPLHPMLPRDPARPLPTPAEIEAAKPELYTAVYERLQMANRRYARYFDAKHSEVPPLRPGDFVWLSGKNLATQRASRKLDHLRRGPFRVAAAVGERAFRLELPRNIPVHPVFHASLLEPAIRDPIWSRRSSTLEGEHNVTAGR